MCDQYAIFPHMQFNLGEDGIGGGNLEHCAADGICGISLLPFLLQMLLVQYLHSMVALHIELVKQ